MKGPEDWSGPASMRNHSRTTSTNADSFRRVEVITGVGRRRRWSLEDKARIVAESLDPATTSSAVARRYGLHASQLFVWRQQLQRSALSAETVRGPGFVPVLLAEDGAPPAEAAGRMEIALGPAVVRVGVDVDGPALRRVLEVVRSLARSWSRQVCASCWRRSRSTSARAWMVWRPWRSRRCGPTRSRATCSSSAPDAPTG